MLAQSIYPLMMFIAFGLILPISSMLFYFGRSVCKMSLERRTTIHYVGYIGTATLCIIGTLFDVIFVDGDHFQSIHSVLGGALCLILIVSICIFAAMRRYKYGLQIWVDFVWCSAVWTLASYLMVSGLSKPLYHYGVMAWCALIVVSFIALAVYSYLTSDAIKFTMVIARGEDIGPCDGSMYHDDGDLDEDAVGLNNGRSRIPFTVTASNTVSSEMDREPDEMCMV